MGALSVPALAHADSDSTSSVSDDATSGRGVHQSGGPERPTGVRGSGRGGGAESPVRRERGGVSAASAVRAPQRAVPVAVPAPDVVAVEPSAPVVAQAVGTNVVAPEAVPPVTSEPTTTAPAVTIAAQVDAPEPPRLAAAVAPRASGVVDALAVGSGTPLPSALAWTMLAAARSEVGRRPASAVVPAAAVTTSAPADPVGQAVSPLGTPEQIAAETAAMQTVHTLPMLAMKAVLNVAWRIIGGIQYAQVGGPDKANLGALGQAVEEWAMGVGFQLMILNSNEPNIAMQVAPPHQWYGLDVIGSRILYDNPDTIYRFAGVNYASKYVITGRLPERDPAGEFQRPDRDDGNHRRGAQRRPTATEPGPLVRDHGQR